MFQDKDGWFLMCSFLKMLTIWSKETRLHARSTLLSTLYPFCLPFSFYVARLSYSPSPSLFSVFSPSFSLSRSLMGPSDASLLKMCLFPSYDFKTVACITQGPGNTLLSPCICDSLNAVADLKWQWSGGATSHDITGRISLSKVDQGSHIHWAWLVSQITSIHFGNSPLSLDIL